MTEKFLPVEMYRENVPQLSSKQSRTGKDCARLYGRKVRTWGSHWVTKHTSKRVFIQVCKCGITHLKLAIGRKRDETRVGPYPHIQECLLRGCCGRSKRWRCIRRLQVAGCDVRVCRRSGKKQSFPSPKGTHQRQKELSRLSAESSEEYDESRKQRSVRVKALDTTTINTYCLGGGKSHGTLRPHRENFLRAAYLNRNSERINLALLRSAVDWRRAPMGRIVRV